MLPHQSSSDPRRAKKILIVFVKRKKIMNAVSHRLLVRLLVAVALMAVMPLWLWPFPAVTTNVYDVSSPDVTCSVGSPDRLPTPRRVLVCVMANTAFQSRVLRTFLHETMPYADDVVIAEFPIGFDLHPQKDLQVSSILAEKAFKGHKVRVHPFHPKLKDVMPVARWLRRDRNKKAWGVEEYFRCYFNNFLKEIKPPLEPGDVVVSNLDVDEVPHRSTLLAWKNCRRIRR